MKHCMPIAAIAVAALIVGACAGHDGASTFSTEPGGKPTLRVTTTTSATVLDSRTHQLRPVETGAPRVTGVSAAIVSGSELATDLFSVSPSQPGVPSGSGSWSMTFTDASGHRHGLVLLYPSAGGPPAAMQHYVDGVLVTTSAYKWQKITGGWVRTSSYLQAVKAGKLYGTYSVATAVTQTGSGGSAPMLRIEKPARVGLLQKMIGGVGYGLAFAFAPQDAMAQYSPAFGPCSQEWLKYAGAAAVTVGYAAVIVDAPIVGALLATQFVGSLALLAASEDALLNCVLSHQQASVGASGGAAFKLNCANGSYAEECQAMMAK